MTERLTSKREAEIAARAEAATTGPWGSYRDLAGVYTVQARPRITRHGSETDGDIATLAAGRSDGESYANARFIGHSREDVPALLAELATVRAERDEARKELAAYEVMNPQQCPAGKHADWLVDSEYTHACPWCAQEEATRVFEDLYRRFSQEQRAGSALYAALTMPTTPEQRQAALDQFTAVAHQVSGSEAAR